MAAGVATYRDVVAKLTDHGYIAQFTQTGGMSAAIEVRLESGWTVLVTDEDDPLSWHRSLHQGWGVGIYRTVDDYDSGPRIFLSTADSSTAALVALLERLLRES